MIPKMTEREKQILVEVMRNAIEDSDAMWSEGKSHAEIVGFLQGTIKAIASILDTTEIVATK